MPHPTLTHGASPVHRSWCFHLAEDPPCLIYFRHQVHSAAIAIATSARAEATNTKYPPSPPEQVSPPGFRSSLPLARPMRNRYARRAPRTDLDGLAKGLLIPRLDLNKLLPVAQRLTPCSTLHDQSARGTKCSLENVVVTAVTDAVTRFFPVVRLGVRTRVQHVGTGSRRAWRQRRRVLNRGPH